jgi:hypothetical protein
VYEEASNYAEIANNLAAMGDNHAEMTDYRV